MLNWIQHSFLHPIPLRPWTVALAVGADFLYDRSRGGETGMRKIWAVVVAVSLGMALSACSKCDVPDLMQKSCKGGTGPSQTLAGIRD